MADQPQNQINQHIERYSLGFRALSRLSKFERMLLEIPVQRQDEVTPRKDDAKDNF